MLRETQLTISVGVAPCKYVAKVAADLDKSDGLVVVPGDKVIGFLAPLAVSHLWGVGKGMQEHLGRLGFKTIGDIQTRSVEELKHLLGDATGAHFYNIARGMDDRPVVSSYMAKSISNESTFGQDLIEREDCRNVLINLSDLVGRRLRKIDVTAFHRGQHPFPSFRQRSMCRKEDTVWMRHFIPEFMRRNLQHTGG